MSRIRSIKPAVGVRKGKSLRNEKKERRCVGRAEGKTNEKKRGPGGGEKGCR